MSQTADSIALRLADVRRRVDLACRQYGRPPEAVEILAVSKTHPASALEAAAACGQQRFGESYVQEATTKIAALTHLECEWHFIGPLQSNKTALVAQHFHWVQSLDRARIAERLNDQRPAELPPLQVCLQVNISGETSKSGARPEELAALAERVNQLPRLALRGLMAIPRRTADFAAQRDAFRAVHDCFLELRSRGYPLDTLSMGMSGDLEAAIAEGSTLVRIGTAIFGERPPHP